MASTAGVAADLDSARLQGPHLLVMLVAAVAMLFDGFDYQSIAFAVPLIKQEWSLDPNAMGALLSASFVGLCVGSIGASYVSDRIGRKKAVALCIFIYSVFTGCGSLAHNYDTLLAFRCLTGVGLGGAIPITVAWLTEFLPAKKRAFIISVTIAFFAIGWVLASGAALLVIPSYGWRAFFAIGALPLLLALVVLLWCPESPLWLVKRGRLTDAAAIAATINVRSDGLRLLAMGHDAAGSGKTASWLSLFGSDLRKTTIIISTLYFCINGFSAGVTQWMPSLLINRGLSSHDSFLYSLVVNVGPILGIFTMGYLLDAIGRRITFVAFWLIGACFTALFSIASGAASVMISGFGLTFFAISTYVCLDVITGEIYPTEVRSSAIGWGMGIGRIGGILGPMLGGFLLSHGFSYADFFLIFTIPLLVNVVVSLSLRYATPIKPVSQSTGVASLASS